MTCADRELSSGTEPRTLVEMSTSGLEAETCWKNVGGAD